MTHPADSVTWTPRTSIAKAVSDQFENRMLSDSTVTSLKQKRAGSSTMRSLRTEVLSRRFLATAWEFMNPNLTSSSGSSRSHGSNRAASLRRIMPSKNIFLDRVQFRSSGNQYFEYGHGSWKLSWETNRKKYFTLTLFFAKTSVQFMRVSESVNRRESNWREEGIYNSHRIYISPADGTIGQAIFYSLIYSCPNFSIFFSIWSFEFQK